METQLTIIALADVIFTSPGKTKNGIKLFPCYFGEIYLDMS